VIVAKSVLHLVRGARLPPELSAAGPGDTIVFLAAVPPAPLPPSRLLVLGPDSDPAEGIGHEDLLELIFRCDSVVTW